MNSNASRNKANRMMLLEKMNSLEAANLDKQIIKLNTHMRSISKSIEESKRVASNLLQSATTKLSDLTSSANAAYVFQNMSYALTKAESMELGVKADEQEKQLANLRIKTLLQQKCRTQSRGQVITQLIRDIRVYNRLATDTLSQSEIEEVR